jgi:hypothetical protein
MIYEISISYLDRGYKKWKQTDSVLYYNININLNYKKLLKKLIQTYNNLKF